MEVILLERVEKLGLMGDVVNVKPGYARNYLLPKNKAISATAKNKEQFENMRNEYEATNLKTKTEAENKGCASIAPAKLWAVSKPLSPCNKKS